MKSLRTVFVSLLLLSCSNHTSTESPSLKIVSIRLTQQTALNQWSLKNYPQIVFEFNRDISLPGSVPSAEQIAAIEMSGNLKAKCIWRFIQKHILACEMDQKLETFTDYQITIAKTFSALGKTLEKTEKAVITTPRPIFILQTNGEPGEFPNESFIMFPSEESVDIGLMQPFLKLRGPNGALYDSTLILNRANRYDEKYDIRLVKPELKWPEGEYQWILTEGAQFSQQGKKSVEPTVLDDFEVTSKTKFIGYSCGYSVEKLTVNLIHNGKPFQCDHERLFLAFSRPVPKEDIKIASTHLADQVTTNEEPKRSNMLGQRYWVEIVLPLNSRNIIDFSSLKLDNNTQPDERVIEVVTQNFPANWELPDAREPVVEQGYPADLNLLAINPKEMRMAKTALTSKERLLRYLNGELNLPTPSPIKPAKTYIKDHVPISYFPIDYLGATKQRSGLLRLALQGREFYSSYEGGEERQKSQTNWINVSTFNLTVWHGNSLFLQAQNWNGVDLAEVTISLVCEGMPAPTDLGSTSKNGTLEIAASKWQEQYSTYQNEECWLWANSSGGSATIELPSRIAPIEAKAQLYTAQPIYQPGSTVFYGAQLRQTSTVGFVPLLYPERYQLQLLSPEDQVLQTRSLDALTKFGFVQGHFALAPSSPVGQYTFKLHELSTGNQETIGSFKVSEFNVPEFEVGHSLQESLNAGERLVARVNVAQKNSAPLHHAKLENTLDMQRKYGNPDQWPENFEFVSWEDHKNGDDKPSFESTTTTLSPSGQFVYTSPVISSTLPLGTISLISQVTANDGNTRYVETDVTYFGRQHYLGSRYDADKHAIQFIAIEPSGDLISGVKFDVDIIEKVDDKEHVLAQCHDLLTPAQCPLPPTAKRFKLRLKSGTENYLWERSITEYETEKQTNLYSRENFGLTLSQTEAKQGDSIQLTLNSDVEGVATFIVSGDNVLKSWQMAVKQGENTLPLLVEKHWQPMVNISATLTLSRQNAMDRITADFQRGLEAGKSADQIVSQIQSSERGRRFYHSSETLRIKSALPEPNIQISLDRVDVEVGSELTMSLSATTESEVQLWIVNDGIFDLTGGFDAKSYDLSEGYYFSNQRTNTLKIASLSEGLSEYRLFQSLINQFDSNAPHKGLTVVLENYFSGGARAMMRAGGLVRDMETVTVTGSVFVDQGVDFANRFALSKWIGTQTLSANVPQKITIPIPSILGKWRIVAVAANKNGFDTSTKSFNTTSSIEYAFDAPTHIFEGDTSTLAIGQLNKGSELVSDNLTVWIDGQDIQSISVSLEANQYKRHVLSIPQLSAGPHLLLLTSEKMPKQISAHKIEVHSSLIRRHLRFELTDDNLMQFALPPFAKASSVQISTKAAHSDSPDWHAFALSHKDYPHQCWEQNLSRALSYAANPVASEVWPDGKTILQQALSHRVRYHLFDGYYSFFGEDMPDELLTAFHYLASNWLSQSEFHFTKVDTSQAQRVLNEIIENSAGSFSGNYAQSMAFLALAQNRWITLEQGLSIREKIGVADNYSIVLQSLGLKLLGADPKTYLSDLSAAIKQGYQDDTVNLFNDTSKECFALMVFDPSSKEYLALKDRVLSKQQNLGHFGSTFADAICSRAFAGELRESNPYNSVVEYSTRNNVISFKPADPLPAWVKVDYETDVTDIPVQRNGLNLSRTYFVRDQGEWREVDESRGLLVGEILKVELKIQSSIARDHVAIVDSVAGGFEAVNLDFTNEMYVQDYDDSWYYQNHMKIEDNRVNWYLRALISGETKLTYYARIRHAGSYLAPPAEAYTMYRNDVYGGTSHSKITVLGQQ